MVEYGFYIESYRGSSISTEDWRIFGLRAEEQLARYKRIYTVAAVDERAEMFAVCAMADALAYFAAVQNGAGGAIASTSIGSVSVNYGGAQVDVSPRAQEKELYRCACQFLDIYRGVG